MMFADELTEPRQRLYWQLFRDRVTIDEWEEACTQAMQRETFHKVPLPAALYGYIEASHREQTRQRVLEEAQQAEDLKRVATSDRLALEASPAWRANQEARRIENQRARQEWADFCGKQPYEWHVEMGLVNPPRPPLQHLPEFYEYTPQGDPDAAKRKARAQLAQLLANQQEETARGTS